MNDVSISQETKLRIPQDSVLAALRRNVALKTISQTDSDDIFWFYSFAQQNRMGLVDAGEYLGMSTQEAWNVIMGRSSDYGSALVRIREMKRTMTSIKGNPFFETSTWGKVSQVCDYAATARKPVFIYGESQIGKTTCLEHWRDLNDAGRVKILNMPVGPTLGGVIYELAKMLYIPPRGYSAEIKSRVYDAIDGRMVIIIDEVHRAFKGTSTKNSIRIMEFLRSIFDNCKCGMVLSGTNVFKTEMEEGPIAAVLDQFRRRGIVSLVLPIVTPRADINEIAASFGLPTLCSDPSDASMIVTRMVRDSGIGQFITYLHSAKNIAAKLRQPIAWQHFIAAHDVVASLSQNLIAAN